MDFSTALPGGYLNRSRCGTIDRGDTQLSFTVACKHIKSCISNLFARPLNRGKPMDLGEIGGILAEQM